MQIFQQRHNTLRLGRSQMLLRSALPLRFFAMMRAHHENQTHTVPERVTTHDQLVSNAASHSPTLSPRFHLRGCQASAGAPQPKKCPRATSTDLRQPNRLHLLREQPVVDEPQRRFLVQGPGADNDNDNDTLREVPHLSNEGLAFITPRKESVVLLKLALWQGWHVQTVKDSVQCIES